MLMKNYFKILVEYFTNEISLVERRKKAFYFIKYESNNNKTEGVVGGAGGFKALISPILATLNLNKICKEWSV